MDNAIMLSIFLVLFVVSAILWFWLLSRIKDLGEERELLRRVWVEPATYRWWQVKAENAGARVKASFKRALVTIYRPEPG